MNKERIIKFLEKNDFTKIAENEYKDDDQGYIISFDEDWAIFSDDENFLKVSLNRPDLIENLIDMFVDMLDYTE